MVSRHPAAPRFLLRPGHCLRGCLVLLWLVSFPVHGAEIGFTSLFDGKTLSGWTLVNQHGPGYLVRDGLLICPADGGGNLFTQAEYSDFVFRFEFRLHEGSNNGVGIRAPLEGDAAYTGMEIQILDHDAPQYRGWLRPEQRHGSVYDVVPAAPGFLKPLGEWNSEEIRAEGRRVQVVLNGHTILDADLDQVRDPAVLKKHPGLARASGHIGFLGHSSPVEFRRVEVKRLR